MYVRLERFDHPVPTAVAIGQPSAIATNATPQRKSHIGTDRTDGINLSMTQNDNHEHNIRTK